MSVDPVTHFSQSPYNAFDGNPVMFADPSGADSYGMAGQQSKQESNRGQVGFGNSLGNRDPLNINGVNLGQGRTYGSTEDGANTMFGLINAFISYGLTQVVAENESFICSLNIFTASEDLKAFNFLISSSDDGYGNFIEMAALVTENSTFIFNDSRNNSIRSVIDTKFYKSLYDSQEKSSFFKGERILAQVHTHNEFSEIESTGDFFASSYFRVPVYALDIATSMIGRGFDFRKIEGVHGNSYESRGAISSISALLNGNFNIRNDAKNILQQAGF